MKIAILGYGIQSRSAYEYFHKHGHEITIRVLDKNTELPEEAQHKIGEDYLSDLDQYDLIVRSPIIHPKELIAANSPGILEKVTTPTNEFFKVSPSKNIIGVTGTKGKGTTSTLISRMLEEAGEKVHLGGNIGISPLDLLKNKIKPSDWVVLELANFQIIDIQFSPKIAACLLVVPEHLDWHLELKDYIKAKQQLFIHQSHQDKAIYYAKNELSKEVVSISKGHKIPYFEAPGAEVMNSNVTIARQVICKTEELKLLGKHNWQNVCAAVTVVWQITQNVDAIRKVLTTFSGLEHRIELVRELDRVKYYNDAFASTPDATIAAIEAVTQPKVLIVGGFERNLPLEHLAKSIKDNGQTIRKTILIGSSGPRIAENLDKVGYSNYELNTSKTLDVIVDRAGQLAESGDAILFSPGFASFDMFKNFEERGMLYKNKVLHL